MGRIVYDEDDLYEISQTVAQHDLGSLGHRIKAPNDLLSKLIVADNLWMVSFPHGPRADVLRGGDKDTPDAVRRQLRKNLPRFRERIEKALGSKEIGDGEKICKCHLKQWAEYFGTTVEALENEATDNKKQPQHA